MDAAYEGHNDPKQSKAMAVSINTATKQIVAECVGHMTQDRILCSPLILRPEGPVVTVAVFSRSVRRSTYGDIVATGLIRLRSNHRVLCIQTEQLGRQGIPQYHLKYVEGPEHKSTPAFAIGDLSQTDQALRYLMSCWALTGCRPEWASEEPTPLTDDYLVSMATMPYPASADTETYRSWPTDDALEQALRPRPMTKVA